MPRISFSSSSGDGGTFNAPIPWNVASPSPDEMICTFPCRPSSNVIIKNCSPTSCSCGTPSIHPLQVPSRAISPTIGPSKNTVSPAAFSTLPLAKEHLCGMPTILRCFGSSICPSKILSRRDSTSPIAASRHHILRPVTTTLLPHQIPRHIRAQNVRPHHHGQIRIGFAFDGPERDLKAGVFHFAGHLS